MDTNFRVFALLILVGTASSPVRAMGEDYELDYQSSQAVFRAIEACKSDGCDLNAYRFSVKRGTSGTEVTLVGRQLSANELFTGDEEHVTERHYLIDLPGRKLIRKWYGK
ncbi:hypothetical protein EC912_101808 [Luteibacter rhizovicinus]|uniref:Uncharacterized protein n=1 Tax=Luteibacter rhizovicinus TaxID=242606 RepID=A0A4R3YYF2_9GAMM|nr:hypothetical protein [Luteibacter rhizovicinus]TCV97791.1 hypothetical protein EC912_101808 [Luteibacter rhizovicinus]